MDLAAFIDMIYERILQFMPIFRIVWSGSLVLGAVMLIIAIVLKKNPTRRSPWIVGGIALLMTISSGTQLIASLL